MIMSRASSRVKLSSKGAKSRGEKKSNAEIDVAKKVEIPQLAWKVVPEPSMKKLRELDDVDKVARKLASLLSLTESEVSMKEAAQLDYFVAGYWHALTEWKMTNEQLSAFITILHMLLDNIKSKGLSLSENLKVLQDTVCNVGTPNIPTALDCFTAELAVSVVRYLQSTLFQHYALFHYLFTEEQEEEIFTSKLAVEIPCPDQQQLLYPPPLEESIPLDFYEKCLIQHPQTEQTDQAELTDVPSQDKGVDAVEIADDTADTAGGSGGITLDEELEVSADDLKELIDKFAKSTLQSFQTQMLQKIKEKEDVIVNRLSKLEKTLNTQHH